MRRFGKRVAKTKISIDSDLSHKLPSLMTGKEYKMMCGLAEKINCEIIFIVYETKMNGGAHVHL